MAVVIPRAIYTDTMLETPSARANPSAKSYTLQCDMFDFLDPAQGIRIEVWESTDNQATWHLATASPAPTPQNPDPYEDGGLDKNGQMRQPAIEDLTGVRGNYYKGRVYVRGACDMDVSVSVN